MKGDRDSGVDKATRCTARGSKPVWVGDFLFATPVQNGPGAHPESCTRNTEPLPGGRAAGGGGTALITHPNLGLRFRVGTAITPLLLSAYQAY
jgi:hypothetical protein